MAIKHRTHELEKSKFASILRTLSQKALVEQRWYGLYFFDRSYQPVIYKNKKWLLEPETQAKQLADNSYFQLIINDKAVSTQAVDASEDDAQVLNYTPANNHFSDRPF